MRTLISLLILVLVYSCNSEQSQSNSVNNSDGISVEIKYAEGFEITEYKDHKELVVKNPWQGADGVEYKYILVPQGTEIDTPDKDAVIIYTPVEKVVCLSTTHVSLIDFVNKTNTIVGVSNLDLVNNQKVRSRIDKGETVEVGFENNLNYELILSLNPDLVISYGVGGDALSYINKLNDLGINVIMNGEYLEQSVLGRAEWCKFIAALYDESKLADDKFTEICNQYSYYSELSKGLKIKPDVMSGLPWKGTWYVSGGKSYLSKIINDAGGNYMWNDQDTHEATPMNLETVYGRAKSADYWINIGFANSKDDMLSVDSRLNEFKAFNNSNVYNNNALLNEYQGNDYWESGIVNPHILLKDLIKILHPELLPDHNLKYYKQLK